MALEDDDFSPPIVSSTSTVASSSTSGALTTVGDKLYRGKEIDIIGKATDPKAFKVQIKGPAGKIIIFEASSLLSETRSSNWEGINIVHLPSDIFAYRNTSGRKFNITGKIVSRNSAEAVYNAYCLNKIRAWILPDFGGTGATPPIVYLTAYYNMNVQAVSCVIRSYNWFFPDDVDYIFQDVDEPMPVIGILQVELDEIYSAEQVTAKKWKIIETPPFLDTPDDSTDDKDFKGVADVPSNPYDLTSEDFDLTNAAPTNSEEITDDTWATEALEWPTENMAPDTWSESAGIIPPTDAFQRETLPIAEGPAPGNDWIVG